MVPRSQREKLNKNDGQYRFLGERRENCHKKAFMFPQE